MPAGLTPGTDLIIFLPLLTKLERGSTFLTLYFLLDFQGAVLRRKGNHSFSCDVHSFSSPVPVAALAPDGKGNLLINAVLISAAQAKSGYLETARRLSASEKVEMKGLPSFPSVPKVSSTH